MNKPELTMVTSSDYKFVLAQQILGDYFDLKREKYSIPEYQFLDVKTVVKYKASLAYVKCKGPVLVDDAGIYLAACEGYPGALAKFVKSRVGMNGVLRMLNGQSRYAESVVVIAYCNETMHKDPVVFEGRMRGRISELPIDTDFPETAGFAHLFIPHGAGMPYIHLPEEERKKYSERIIAMTQFLNWAKENILPK